MAIEFKCTYCNAMIRVPDNAGGGKGRCPKCAMRITVPRKSTAKPTAIPPIEEEPFVLPVADEETTETPAPGVLNVLPEFNEVVPLPFDPVTASESRIGELPVERPVRVKSVSRRPKKKKRVNGTGFVIGAILLGLAAASGFYVYPKLVSEHLSGDVIAEFAARLELPPVLIDKSRFKGSNEVVTELLKKLGQNPVPLNSNSMQIQLEGSPKGVLVSLEAGGHAHFYHVNLSANESVQKYLGRHESELEDRRSKEVDHAAGDFLAAYQRVLTKDAPAESITIFRDTLALPSLVGGLGHELVASYGRGLYRCAYEDHNGSLFFLLPVGVKEFDVIGRIHSDGRVIVPANFKVKVQGTIAAAKRNDETKQPQSSKKSEKNVDKDEQKDVGDEMNDKK